MNDPERHKARREGVEPLARRMSRWSPRAAVVVMKAIVPHADAALVRAWRRRRVFHSL
jgi:hypothetical protein